MSLKSFHIIFIVIASLFLIFFGYWNYLEWAITKNTMNLVFSFLSISLCIGLLYYSKWFLKEINEINTD